MLWVRCCRSLLAVWKLVWQNLSVGLCASNSMLLSRLIARWLRCTLLFFPAGSFGTLLCSPRRLQLLSH